MEANGAGADCLPREVLNKNHHPPPMDSPVQIVKSTLNPGNLIKFAVASLAVFALLNLLGWTDWILYPVDTARAKFATPAATP